MASTDRMTQVTLRPIDCSGACHEPDVGCLCSADWRTIEVVTGPDGEVLVAPPLPSSSAVQAAADSLAGSSAPESSDANSLSSAAEAI